MFGGATKPGAPAANPTRKPKRQDRRWQKLQAEQLEREPFCRLCAAEGKPQVKAFEVDHILALADGGSFDDPANLQSLCRLHHYQKTENENARRAGRKPRKVRLRRSGRSGDRAIRCWDHGTIRVALLSDRTATAPN